MIKNRLEWFLEHDNDFSHFQTGFRKGMGIQNNIAFLSSCVELAFSKQETIITVFLDLKCILLRSLK